MITRCDVTVRCMSGFPLCHSKCSSGEAEHPVISAQQGLKLEHMLEAFMSHIEKE